jgi:hypothetical protein
VMLGSRSNIGCWINGNRKEFWLDLYRLFVYVGVTLIVAVIGKDPGFILEGINISSPGSSQSSDGIISPRIGSCTTSICGCKTETKLNFHCKLPEAGCVTSCWISVLYSNSSCIYIGCRSCVVVISNDIKYSLKLLGKRC